MSWLTLLGTSDLLASMTTSDTVGPLVSAPDGVTVRVLVRNIGAVDVFLGLTPGAVVGNPGAQATYRLPAGQADVLILKPRQVVYATGVGAGGRVSYAVSQALPFDVRP
jgi:hypothetical protein